jgi:hypothetical protein
MMGMPTGTSLATPNQLAGRLNELWAHIEIANRPIAQWTNDDWLRLGRNMIKVVEIARDISARGYGRQSAAPSVSDV